MPTSPEAARRADWRKTWVVASVWYCGDEYCNCTQPQIEIVRPNLKASYPWIQRERIWEGTFRTDGEGSQDEWRCELEPAAAEYGITLDENLFGRVTRG